MYYLHAFRHKLTWCAVTCAASDFYDVAFEKASPNIVIALAGNKADLTNNRMVEFEEAKPYADENGLLFMETSAKTAMNVNDIFLAIGT